MLMRSNYLCNLDIVYDRIKPHNQLELDVLEKQGFEILTVQMKDSRKMNRKGDFCNRYASELARIMKSR